VSNAAPVECESLRERANGNGVRRIEAVVLHDNHGPRLARVRFAVGDDSDIAAPRSSPPSSKSIADMTSMNA
jgi:hypothetical protein